MSRLFFLLLVPRVRWGLLTGRGEETSGSPNGDGDDDDDEKIEGGLSWWTLKLLLRGRQWVAYNEF